MYPRLVQKIRDWYRRTGVRPCRRVFTEHASRTDKLLKCCPLTALALSLGMPTTEITPMMWLEHRGFSVPWLIAFWHGVDEVPISCQQELNSARTAGYRVGKAMAKEFFHV